MAKSRLNPNPKSRAGLAKLQEKNVLSREMVGLRHIIRAETGLVEYVGFNLRELHGYVYSQILPNFHPSVPRVTGRVGYFHEEPCQEDIVALKLRWM